MSLISSVDLVTATGSIAALIFLFVGFKTSTKRNEIMLFSSIIALFVFRDISNILEWGGISAVLDPIEDYTEVLSAILCGFFLYTFLQGLTEDALRKSEEWYRILFDSGNDAIFVFGLTGYLSPGNFLEVNNVSCERLGYTRDELLRMSPSDIDFSHDQEAVKGNIKKLLAGEHLIFNQVHVAKDGTQIPVEINAQLFDYHGETTIVAVARDISQRREAERKLREVLELDEKILDGSPVAFVLHDREMRVKRVSKAYEKVSGFHPEDVVERTVQEFMPEGPSRDGVIKRNKRVFDDGVKIGPTEIKSPREEGRFLSETLLPIFDPAGNVVNTLAVLEDITGRKLADDKIKTSLMEKEVLLKEIHHRVKNNLQVISGLLNLQSRYIDNGEAKVVYRESQNRIISMALIHEELYQAKDLASVDFADYVDNLARNLIASFSIDPEMIELSINVEDIRLVVDTAIPCGLIINELLSNSLKHAFTDGETGRVRTDFSIEDDGSFLLEVSDNGKGFPKKLDFRKTKSLGMQLITILTEQLGGSIELNREKGTTFTIRFAEYREAGTTSN